jgi:hypothetical protein
MPAPPRHTPAYDEVSRNTGLQDLFDAESDIVEPFEANQRELLLRWPSAAVL